MKNVQRLSFASILLAGVLLASPVYAQTTDTVPPADIENAAQVVSVADGSVTLQWDVATDNVGVTGYKIYYGTTSLGAQKNGNTNGKAEYTSSKAVDNVNQTMLTGLTNGTKYYFALTAVDAAGNESEFYSPEVEATPVAGAMVANTNSQPASGNANANVAPAANTNSAPSDANNVSAFAVVEKDGKLNFTWTMATDTTVIDQILYVSKNNGTSYDSGMHLGKTLKTYSMETYDASTAYLFKMTTKNASGTESAGVTASITTQAKGTLPTAKDISNLVSKFERVMSKYTVTLTWTLPTDVSGIVAQVVYQSLDGSVFQQLASLGPTIESYQIPGMAPGKYFFKITTKDAAGKESAGVVKMVELPASGPALLVTGLFALAGAGWYSRKKKK